MFSEIFEELEWKFTSVDNLLRVKMEHSERWHVSEYKLKKCVEILPIPWINLIFSSQETSFSLKYGYKHPPSQNSVIILNACGGNVIPCVRKSKFHRNFMENSPMNMTTLGWALKPCKMATSLRKFVRCSSVINSDLIWWRHQKFLRKFWHAHLLDSHRDITPLRSVHNSVSSGTDLIPITSQGFSRKFPRNFGKKLTSLSVLLRRWRFSLQLLNLFLRGRFRLFQIFWDVAGMCTACTRITTRWWRWPTPQLHKLPQYQ